MVTYNGVQEFFIGLGVLIIALAVVVQAGIKVWQNLTGEKKSLFKAIIWLIIWSVNAYTALYVITNAVGFGINSEFPLNIYSVYRAFVIGVAQWAYDAVQFVIPG